METLTTSSLHDAKQNSVKRTDTSELIPTLSEQEIDFFYGPPQPQISTHVRCLTSIFKNIRRLGTTNPTIHSVR